MDRFDQALIDEFLWVTISTWFHVTINALQDDLDSWLV